MRTFAVLALSTLFASSVTAVEYIIEAGDDFEASCLHKVQPGDSCYLEKGDYEHDGLTITHGEEDKRITIKGDKEACIKGSNTQDRVLQIAHDYYTVQDICFDGDHGGDEFVATAIYVLGGDKKETKHGLTSSVTGFKMTNLEIKNFNSECVHFRYFVTDAEVSYCTIQHCGKEAFENGGGGKVGEGIYVGTALDQVDDNKAPEPKIRSGSADNVDADVCQRNHIHHNTFRTYGNECVDVKEGSTNNLIEHNICEQQKDPNSGGFGFRGSGNTARFNDIAECVGAGIRVGGDKGYGTDNDMYANTISNADYGAFNVMADDQGTICGNIISDVPSVFVGSEKDKFSAEDAIGACSDGSSASDNDAGVNGGSDGNDDSGPTESTVETNEGAGSSGLGECATVLTVSKMEVEHSDDVDSTNDMDNLFDGKTETYFSVNRESTSFTFELDDETDVNGVSIGFFMKAESEKRIQTFDILVRSDDDEDWTTVISRKESSGDMDVQYFPFSGSKARYLRFESHGNDYNNWTALTEMEICGSTGEESNALFGGVKAAEKEIQELAEAVCTEPVKLSPVTVKSSGDDDVSVIFDGSFDTRWSTKDTQNDVDLDNGKITMRFLGDQKVSYVNIAFYDGHLASPHFSLYSQSATDLAWTNVLDHEIASRSQAFQKFDVEAGGVHKLYIVGKGNDVGFFTKVSEIEVYGC